MVERKRADQGWNRPGWPRGGGKISRRAFIVGGASAGLLKTAGAPLSASPLIKGPLPVPTPRRSFSFDIMGLGLVIGRHDVRIDGTEPAFSVSHRIFAEVAPFGISLYIFDHESTERFVDGRMVELNCRTREGDSTFFLEGEAIGDEFEIRGRKATRRAPADILVGSFWTPVMLTRSHLIEPKRGRLRETVIHSEQRLTERVGGEMRSFTRYVVSGVLKGHVDYDDSQQWIGCAFETKGTDIVYRYRA